MVADRTVWHCLVLPLWHRSGLSRSPSHFSCLHRVCLHSSILVSLYRPSIQSRRPVRRLWPGKTTKSLPSLSKICGRANPLAYVIGFITTLGTAYLSDKYRRRAPFLMFWSAIATLGYVLLMALPSGKVPGVHYFALFIATAGAAPMIATTISWTGNTWSNGKPCSCK